MGLGGQEQLKFYDAPPISNLRTSPLRRNRILDLFLGRKARSIVLPRVSAALSSLVSPISSAKASQGKDFERANVPKQEVFKRFSKESLEQENPKEQAKVIPLRPDAGISPDRAIMTPVPPNQSLSVAHSLVHLIGMLKDQGRQLTQWMAVKSYRKAAKGKRSQVRKGAMLDRMVE